MDDVWRNAKKITDGFSLTLGPYFAHQAIRQPRHLLFSLARYKFAARLLPLAPKACVLELGANEGLGTMFLAECAARVTAVDFDQNAVEHARSSLPLPLVEFLHDDFLGKIYGTFDAVVSVDVIEHVEPAREDEFFSTVLCNLSPTGMAVIGTPNKTSEAHASEGSTLGHVNLFTAERLYAAMNARFHNVFLFGMNDEVVHTGFYPMCHYLLALGCGPIQAGPGETR